MVGLLPLLEASSLPVGLKPNAREKKNFGGRDSIGSTVGDECGARAFRELKGSEYASRAVERCYTLRMNP